MGRKPLDLGPPQVLVGGFLALIITGTVLLMLPVASAQGQPTGFLDALFTATSAVCVTGLVVVDTGTYWSAFGQLVIMVLIQIGGLGLMTFATLFALLLGRKIGLKERLILQEALNKLSVAGVVRLVRHILVITLCIEGLAALVLAVRWSTLLGWKKAIYFGIFHAVSAFNNAGFDLFGQVTGPFSSLTAFVADPLVALLIPALFILGGIGFAVIVDIAQKRKWSKLSVHSKVVLSTNGILVLIGVLGVLTLEIGNQQTLDSLDIGGKLLAAWFQGVTPRTAGFNTIDIAQMTRATQFLLIMLMFIGASPGSTGGGIKTATFAGLFIYLRAVIIGKDCPAVFERSLPRETINKVVAVTTIAFLLVMTTTFVLLISERQGFLATLFEATSAFGTVGLSMGLTTHLSSLGRLAIIITMFVGRVGPLTLAFALAQKRKKVNAKYPEEKLMIG